MSAATAGAAAIARPQTIAQALDLYARAAARRAYWEDNGHRGDGKLEAAQYSERTARANVERIVADTVEKAAQR